MAIGKQLHFVARTAAKATGPAHRHRRDIATLLGGTRRLSCLSFGLITGLSGRCFLPLSAGRKEQGGGEEGGCEEMHAHGAKVRERAIFTGAILQVANMGPTPPPLLYELALTFAPEVGDRTGRALLERFGSAEGVLKAPIKELVTVEGVGLVRAKGLKEPDLIKRAEEEIAFAEKAGVQIIWHEDERFPARLRSCADAPLILYFRGSGNPNPARAVAIVGTRKATDYGVKLCEDLVDGLAAHDVTIVSGLAHGIDAVAHRRSLAAGCPTIGVVAHGLERMYPHKHKSRAQEMEKGGGVLTEFPSHADMHPNNFPVRNRIVAGMSDVTVVVETDLKGGSMITAYLAHGYNRDVAAFPGRVGDSRSAGCNALIGRGVASLITSADDLLTVMGWQSSKKKAPVPRQLALALSAEEQRVVDVMQGRDSIHADELLLQTGLPYSQLAGTLLQLELQGVVRTLAGKMYRLS